MYEYFYKGRKPSNQQILKQVNQGINEGHDYIEISWGENVITLDKQLVNGKREAWYGWGWIRNISGADIATKINQVQHNNNLNLWNT